MTPGPATAERPEAPLFADGLGERVVAVDAATGDLLQILRLRPQLLAIPSFEFALRERAARLANFRHAYYARVRRVDRHPTGIAIVSDHVEGVRLSEMLRVAHSRRLQLDLNAALCLLRQLVPSIALLHENARDVAHGLISPERLIVTPRARLVVVEHVLGSAVEQLQFGRERLWQELRVAVPMGAGAVRFDHRADVIGIGMTALALVIGRPIETIEHPMRVPALLAEARARSAGTEDQPLPGALHAWLARALQVDPRHGFANATEAQIALEDALAEDSGFVAAPIALETFLSRYIGALLDPVAPAPAAASASVSLPAPVQREPEGVSVKPPVPPPAPVARVAQIPVVPVTVAPAPVAPASFAPVPVTALPVAPAPVAAAPKLVDPPTPVPSAPTPVRDITELLKDFDLPPVPAAASAVNTSALPLPPESAVAVLQQNEPEPLAPAPPRSRARLIAIAAAAIVVVGVGGVYASKSFRATPPPAAALGTLSVQTNPPGLAVFIDGQAKGNTPARVSLPAGSHTLELRGRGVPRVIPVTITAGTEASQYLEVTETPAAGSLLVQSDPAGARVFVDGVERGVAPASVADLTPGEHEVTLQAEGGAPVKQRVLIQAGVTSTVLAPVSTAAPGPVSGWLAVKSPVTIEIHEGGRMIGTTDSQKIMMAAGRHDVEFVNETLGYRAKRSIQVTAGKVAPITVELPQGVMHVNASPWAEVYIDGRKVGDTPLGNIPVSIGPHEVVFRHPQFGEKRQAVSVTLHAPVRLSMDMK